MGQYRGGILLDAVATLAGLGANLPQDLQGTLSRKKTPLLMTLHSDYA